MRGFKWSSLCVSPEHIKPLKPERVESLLCLLTVWLPHETLWTVEPYMDQPVFFR